MPILRKIGAFAIAAAMTLCLAVPVLAAESEASSLFREGLASRENYVSVKDYPDEDDKDYYEMIEVDLIVRKAKNSVTLTSDAKVVESLKLTIPKNTTLTVEEGVTLTVLGNLIIEGSLINKGTVIVGKKEGVRNGGFADIDEQRLMSPYINRLTLENKGSIQNEGSLQILNGAVINNKTATLDNSGSLTISSSGADWTALKNIAQTTGGQTLRGTIRNSGTITVKNTGGTGIHNYTNAVIQNDGQILKSAKGTIKGKISGTQPKSA